MRLHRILCDEAVTGAAVPVEFLSTVRQPLIFFIIFLGCGSPLPLGAGRSNRHPIFEILYIFVLTFIKI